MSLSQKYGNAGLTCFNPNLDCGETDNRLVPVLPLKCTRVILIIMSGGQETLQLTTFLTSIGLTLKSAYCTLEQQGSCFKV